MIRDEAERIRKTINGGFIYGELVKINSELITDIIDVLIVAAYYAGIANSNMLATNELMK